MIIEITEQEANVLLELINEAVKVKGLSVVNNAAFFMYKIQEAGKNLPNKEVAIG